MKKEKIRNNVLKRLDLHKVKNSSQRKIIEIIANRTFDLTLEELGLYPKRCN